MQNLVAKMRKAPKKVDKSYGEGIDLEEASMNEVQQYANLLKNDEIDNYNCTSWCRFPFYDAHFGWGTPVWVSVSGVTFRNMVFLMDSRDEDGIEAWLILKEKDMALVGSNKELLAFASPNPSIIYN
ncbi:hypothetical protein FEM48_Zijuj07G0066700 [Ziziphus jujuba var. spinosa]|uniref:BAHD acyltransferase BIA1-like n=1 Tax=Ziziphus jujuba var. spinosa TaxID=714518 RepID=A0A978V328_ZIZJJ|nr:hypothetical protein FEM48_Zijuj07G0066700 [Ziziphus jujuba var. spinosa]